MNQSPPTPPQLPHWPVRGVLFGCGGAFLFTLQDAAFKWLSADYAVAQIIFVRCFTTLAVAILWLHLAGGKSALRLGRPRLFAVSALANIAAWFCFYTGLSALPLTVAISVFFLVPVAIALLAVPILGERPTWRQAGALICGLAGVLIITAPWSSAAADLAAIAWILASVVMWALVAVLTRALGPTMTVSGALFYFTIGFLLFSGVFQPFVWKTPTINDLLGMLAIGLVSAAAQACVLAAYRSARAAVAATAEYSALVWAALLGWLLWEERQTWGDLAGIALIVAAGVAVLFQRDQKTAHHP